VLALAPPTVRAYDPAFAYELAAIVQEGMTRMFCHEENWIYYLTVENETYRMPPMPKHEGVREGIIKGMYRYRASGMEGRSQKPRAHLLGSGAILNEAIAAQGLLAEKYGVAADVWSVTSYKELYRDAVETERWNLLHPGAKPLRTYLQELIGKEKGVFVAASDYLKVLPAMVAKWLPGRLHCLGTDGFGRSDGRAQLRDFFEVDRRYIALAALRELVEEGAVEPKVLKQAIKDLDVDPEKANPHID
jgi:pyruvate dehydrogenase E1 component